MWVEIVAGLAEPLAPGMEGSAQERGMEGSTQGRVGVKESGHEVQITKSKNKYINNIA